MARVRYSFGSRHTGHLLNIKKQRSKYPDVMRKVVDSSDIVLEILDSRFIEDTRNLDIEEDLRIKGKKLIFVLNKADLVDSKSIEKKLPKDLKPFIFVSTKTGQGARALRDLIKMECKRVDLEDKKTDLKNSPKVEIGVIGYPNVGKSSIINLITRRGVAKTSKQAGYTKGMQKIRFSDSALVLDTPGVIPKEKYSSNRREFFSRDAKLGARTYSDVKNPEDVVHYLMTPITPENEEKPTKEELRKIEEVERQALAIEAFYGIDAKGDSEVLIEKLGKKKNFLRKGGKIDMDRASRQILRDWQEGKIKIR